MWDRSPNNVTQSSNAAVRQRKTGDFHSHGSWVRFKEQSVSRILHSLSFVFIGGLYVKAVFFLLHYLYGNCIHSHLNRTFWEWHWYFLTFLRFLYLVCAHVRVVAHAYHSPWRSEDNCSSWFPSSAMWVPGIKFGKSGWWQVPLPIKPPCWCIMDAFILTNNWNK